MVGKTTVVNVSVNTFCSLYENKKKLKASCACEEVIEAHQQRARRLSA